VPSQLFVLLRVGQIRSWTPTSNKHGEGEHEWWQTLSPSASAPLSMMRSSADLSRGRVDMRSSDTAVGFKSDSVLLSHGRKSNGLQARNGRLSKVRALRLLLDCTALFCSRVLTTGNIDSILGCSASCYTLPERKLSFEQAAAGGYLSWTPLRPLLLSWLDESNCGRRLEVCLIHPTLVHRMPTCQPLSIDTTAGVHQPLRDRPTTKHRQHFSSTVPPQSWGVSGCHLS
jgi:hypothetical protein